MGCESALRLIMSQTCPELMGALVLTYSTDTYIHALFAAHNFWMSVAGVWLWVCELRINPFGVVDAWLSSASASSSLTSGVTTATPLQCCSANWEFSASARCLMHQLVSQNHSTATARPMHWQGRCISAVQSKYSHKSLTGSIQSSGVAKPPVAVPSRTLMGKPAGLELSSNATWRK